MNFLIVKTSSIGDIVQAMAVLPYLASKGSVDWVVEEKFASLLEGNQYIREVIPVTRKKFWKVPRKKYDVVFDLQGNCKSALFTFLAKAKVKVGFALKSVPEWPNILVTNFRVFVDESIPIQLRYLTVVARYFGEEAALTKTEMRSCNGPLMICPGSNWENKRIAPEVWITALEKLDCETVIVWGSESERGVAVEIAGNVGKKCRAIGGLSFSEWKEEMKKCSGVVSVDSCALHLAASLGIPTFSLFGPSSAKVYAPVGEIHASLSGRCPYDISFAKRCPKLRTCATGLCIKMFSGGQIAKGITTWREGLSQKSADQNRCETPQAQLLR